MDLAGELPIPITQQLELQHIWRLTRQKLDYFRRELERADARFRNELEQLHNALLPEIIACQVRLSNCILERFCLDSCFTEQWKAIWLNTERA